MGRSSLSRGRTIATLAVAGLVVALLPTAGSAAPAGPASPWTKVEPGAAARSAKQAKEPEIRTERFAGFTLDRPMMASELQRVAPQSAEEVLLPTPEGTVQRFSLVDTPVMESGLAAKHPEIKTYSGKGIDDPTATVRADLTPLGFHASVRSAKGSWFVDPYYKRDRSLYASYYGHDLANPAGPLVEHEDIEELVQDVLPADAGPIVKLRTYRLALVTDPSYATYFGAENVTAAKVTLVNRVAQIYEDETAIRLLLINDTDKTNLNTVEQATGPNGPCGAAACYTTAQIAGCTGSLLNRNQIVLGQLVGASAYDVGHIGLGVNGGGVAGLGVVGGSGKARGCTGLPTPVGDFYAVDYVAHEVGHQFAGNHTFNGTQVNCSGGNRSAANSYEPGSGSSIMAYAGICQQDNLQPHSDPYWSQRSYTEISTFTSTTRPVISEVQNVSLTAFDGTDSFTLSYGGQASAAIVRGTNYTAAGIKAAIEGTQGWPAGATVSVSGFGGGVLNDTGFQVAFGGALAGVDVPSLTVTGTGTSGFAGETVDGGPQENIGFKVEDTANHAPVVSVPSSYTIPVRTPFALNGSATDADGDKLTYLWEQNDRGAAAGTALVNNTKTAGPLFRQFGTAAIVTSEDTLKYYSPGENAVNGETSRVFPDYPQIAAGNTNAKTGACPAAPAPPAAVPAALVDCFSEFLPTADWVGFTGDRTLHFRLTARDYRPGGGGIGTGDTALKLASTAGPFLVTSQATGGTYPGGSAQPITWDVAGTNVAPVDAANVKISLSTDGGLTFPHVLAESTPNDGSETLTLPDLATTKARIKIEAVGNVFFDLSDADFTIQASPRVTLPADSPVQYSDAVSLPVTASDPDSPATGLTATAAGLPAGLSLVDNGAGAWTISGTVTAAPGSYPVSVSVKDDSGLVGKSSFVLQVKPEDAVATYTGDALVYGGSVLLRATVQDNTDATPGDVRTGTVTFSAGGQALCSAPLALLGTDATSGSGSCTAQLPLGAQPVTVTVGGNYAGTAAGSVELERSQVSGAIVAGSLRAAKSAGSFAAAPGSKIDLSLVLAHANAKTSGLGTVTFQSGGKRYQVLASAFDSFGAKASLQSGSLDLRAKATLKEGSRVVGFGLTLRVTASGGLLGSHGAASVSLYDGEKLLFSSEWTGASTASVPLTGGAVLVA
ncbi:Putative Ig domain-containing protein [Amycolatopsis xylanica]|uniref:Putative Ig domain-containing protein n=1 Tax=Amycolatopsis xylanica TaxID=589385 RepID=A0A1H2W2E9_9PSEU|nr:Putative Ig domain-containing protein [Amycolatopsis xylanica]